VRRWALVVLWTLQLELRRWVRQPLAVATAVVLPVAVACIVTAALGGSFSYTTTWAVVDHDHGPVGDAFIDRALADPALREVVTVRRTSEDEARRLLDEQDVSAAIILPADLTERVGPTRGPRLEVLRPGDAWLGTELAEVVVDAFSVQAWAEVERARRGDAAQDGAPRLGVSIEAAGGRRLDAASHFGPAVGLFFVLLALGFGAQAAVGDRLNGTSDRLRAARAPATAVSLGQGLFGMLVGGLSLVVTGLVLGVVFDRGWGSPGPVVVLVLAVLLCFTGLAAVVARFTTSASGVQFVTTGIAFVMAIGSGSFAPPGSTVRPAFGDFVPVSWALDGFARLATGGGLTSIRAEVVYLSLAGSLLVGLVALAGRRAA
jgi:ABC-2 type transport system permease protein